MAITNLFNRASKLEDSLEHLRLQKAKEDRDAWRQANSERLKWEMFLRVHGRNLWRLQKGPSGGG
jgi:hypothetical protein